MKIICISDTHSQHQQLLVPPGDVLIHAGDLTEGGTEREIVDFLNWFSTQPHRHKIFVAGNHDFHLEQLSSQQIEALVPKNIHYLCENGIIINGILFWGSPVVPGNGSWAFSVDSSRKLKEHWDKIPSKTTVLITHSPPYGILDRTDKKLHLGCNILRKKVAKIQPTYHIFGHLHNNYGMVKKKETTFVNATNFSNNFVNPPIKITLNN